MILIISVCKEKLHEYEFVKPVCDILKSGAARYFIKHYNEIGKEDLEKASKIIICGTGIKDNYFIEDIDKFKWIPSFEKSILGICAGMHIIGLVFGGVLERKLEIGYYDEFFKREFLGLRGKVGVYHLHSRYVNFLRLNNFEVFSKGKISQAIKHKTKDFYGTLFHPEVRNKELILRFVGL